MDDMEHAVIKARITKSADDGIYSIWATTWEVDRDNERMHPDSIKNLAEYLKQNPVIYYDHGWLLGDGDAKLPIGKAVNAKRYKEKGIKVWFKFSELEFAQKVKYLVDEGILNSGSIGFIPKKWDYDSDGVRVIIEAELFELSVVGIPANAGAQIIRNLNERDEKVAVAVKSIIHEFEDDEEGEGDEPAPAEEEREKRLSYAQKLKLGIRKK